MITQKDILFASLMGITNLATYERSQLVQNELSKLVLPPIPFLPLSDDVAIEKFRHKVQSENIYSWEADKPLNEDQQFFPLSFAFTESGTKWLFPF